MQYKHVIYVQIDHFVKMWKSGKVWKHSFDCKQKICIFFKENYDTALIEMIYASFIYSHIIENSDYVKKVLE